MVAGYAWWYAGLGIVAHGNVVEGLSSVIAVAKFVECLVQEAQWLTCTLIGNSDNACPLWRTLARTTNAEVTDCTVEETHVDQNRSCTIAIVGNLGCATPTTQYHP